MSGVQNTDIPKPITSAQTVETMKTQIQSELSEDKKAELKKGIDELHFENRDKKIEWSARERGKFVESLKTELDKKENGDVLKLIQNEIENELTENEFDKKAEDYEGIDGDANETRKTIETAWEASTKNLTKNQKDELQNNVLKLMESAARDDGHEIFEDLGIFDIQGLGIGRVDKMVTQKEAEKIAAFIKTEAKKMEEQPSTTVTETSATVIPKTPEKPEEQKTNAEKVLGNKHKTPEWYKTPASKIDPKITAEIEEKFKDSTIVKDMKELGIDLDLVEMKKVLGTILTTKLGDAWYEKLAKKSEVENLAIQIDQRSKNIVKWLNGKYGESAPKVLAKLLEMKKIEKNDTKAITEYIAFGNIKEDMGASEKYFEAQNKLEPNNKIEINENIKAAEINSNLEEIAKDSDLSDAMDNGQKALKSFGEALTALGKGDFAGAFGKAIEALMSFISAITDGTAAGWGFLVGFIPPEIKNSKHCPEFVKGWITKHEEAKKNKEMKDMAIVSELIEATTPADFHKVEDLKEITVAKFLDINNAELATFVEGKEINISMAQLGKIKNKLDGKDIDVRFGEGSLSIYDFLKKKLKENPEYLK